MSYIFKSKDYNSAFNLFFWIQSYSFSDFLNKKNLIFDSSEILSIYVSSWRKNRYLVERQKNASIVDHFFCNELPENFPANQVIIKNEFDLLKIFHTFNLKGIFYLSLGNPVTVCFGTIVILTKVIQFAKSHLQPILWPTQKFMTHSCDFVCTQKLIDTYAILIMIYLPMIFGLIFSHVYYKIIIRKMQHQIIRNGFAVGGYMMWTFILSVLFISINEHGEKMLALHKRLSTGQIEMSSQVGK